jgi:hypothetical protein
LFTFLRSLFVMHDWHRPNGSNVRTCTICGRREELDIDDGVNLTAWYPLWQGYPRAHFVQPQASAVATDVKAPGGPVFPDRHFDVVPDTPAHTLARIREPGH